MKRPLMNCKRKGEYAEARFLLKALDLGLVVSKPWGDSDPYDLVVEGARGLTRVQVKSTWSKPPGNRSNYEVNVGRTPRRLFRINSRMIAGPRRCYSARRVDLMAIYVVPEDLWYFIPRRALGRRTSISLFPGMPRAAKPFERYREAWHLLR